MDATSIDLCGSQVESVVVTDDVVRIRFAPAYLTRTMTGSVERTRWRQDGELVFTQARVVGRLPGFPATCAGGDVGENAYTYRDMVPIALVSRGRATCKLRFEGADGPLEVEAGGVDVKMEGVPKYIEHIRPD